MRTPTDQLLTSLRTTSGSRFNAARRLAERDKRLTQVTAFSSVLVIALTVLKAFLIDMSTLTGVYRELSFMCLGLVLVAIGWLYQRILFRKGAPPPVPAAQPGT